MRYSRPYKHPFDTSRWTVQTMRTKRHYRRQWIAEIAAFVFQNAERISMALDLRRRRRERKYLGRAVLRNIREAQSTKRDRPSAAVAAVRT